MRQRHFAGTSLEPRKLLGNAQTLTSRMHAVLGALVYRQYSKFLNILLFLPHPFFVFNPYFFENLGKFYVSR